MYREMGNKALQLVMQLSCRTVQVMLRVLPPTLNLSCSKSGCSMLCNFVAESREWFYFLKQNVRYMLRVLLPQGNRFCSK